MKVLTVDFKSKALVDSVELNPRVVHKNPILSQVESRFKKSKNHLHLVEENFTEPDSKHELNFSENLSNQIDSLDKFLQNKDYFLMNRYVNNPEATAKAIELLVHLSRSMESLNEICSTIHTQLVYEAGVSVEIPLLEEEQTIILGGC